MPYFALDVDYGGCREVWAVKEEPELFRFVSFMMENVYDEYEDPVNEDDHFFQYLYGSYSKEYLRNHKTVECEAQLILEAILRAKTDTRTVSLCAPRTHRDRSNLPNLTDLERAAAQTYSAGNHRRIKVAVQRPLNRYDNDDEPEVVFCEGLLESIPFVDDHVALKSLPLERQGEIAYIPKDWDFRMMKVIETYGERAKQLPVATKDSNNIWREPNFNTEMVQDMVDYPSYNLHIQHMLRNF